MGNVLLLGKSGFYQGKTCLHEHYQEAKDEHTGLVHKMVSVFGSTILNRYMTPQNGVVPGRMVSITYIGTVKTKRGLNPAKDYVVAAWGS